MSNTFRWISVVALAWLGHAGDAGAQSSSRVADRLHANAVASFRQGRFSEAYGRFILLADAGHARSAEVALWMYQNGPTLFGKEWDISTEQMSAWTELAGARTAPTLACPATALSGVDAMAGSIAGRARHEGTRKVRAPSGPSASLR